MTKRILAAIAIIAALGLSSHALAHCGLYGVGDSKDHSHEGDNPDQFHIQHDQRRASQP